jgi:DNA-binding XRE family transcriptional regulator
VPAPGRAAGMEQLRAEQRAWRLAEMRRRLGMTQAEVAQRMGVTQGRVSAIEHAKPGATELRTLAAYVEAVGGPPGDHRRPRRPATRLHRTRQRGSLKNRARQLLNRHCRLAQSLSQRGTRPALRALVLADRRAVGDLQQLAHALPVAGQQLTQVTGCHRERLMLLGQQQASLDHALSSNRCATCSPGSPRASPPPGRREAS